MLSAVLIVLISRPFYRRSSAGGLLQSAKEAEEDLTAKFSAATTRAAIRQLQGTHSEPNRRSPHRSIGLSVRRNEQRSLGPSGRHLSRDYHQNSIGQSVRRHQSTNHRSRSPQRRSTATDRVSNQQRPVSEQPQQVVVQQSPLPQQQVTLWQRRSPPIQHTPPRTLQPPPFPPLTLSVQQLPTPLRPLPALAPLSQQPATVVPKPPVLDVPTASEPLPIAAKLFEPSPSTSIAVALAPVKPPKPIKKKGKAIKKPARPADATQVVTPTPVTVGPTTNTVNPY